MFSLRQSIHSLMNLTGYDIHRIPPARQRPTLDLLRLAVGPRIVTNSKFFFIQIGANDGMRADPMHELVAAYHPRGICVEPLPDLFAQLAENYSTEPQIKLENAAISQEPGPLVLYRFTRDAPVADDMHGMATFDGKRLHSWAARQGVAQYVKREPVSTMTYADLLRNHAVTHIDLLQVDTEGYDFKIVSMALEMDIKPAIINYEFVHLSQQDQEDCKRLLTKNGYVFADGAEDTLALLTDHTI